MYQDHVKRGGKLITAPQTALYDPKVIDNVNITVLIRQCMVGGVVDLPRLVLPVAMQVNGANAAVPPPKYPAAAAIAGSAGGAADNPFGGPAASQPSTGGGAADNPFGTTTSVGGASGAASARHSHKPSADNPFAGGAGAAAVADNPFGGSSANGRPSAGASVSAADGAMFAARSGAASRKGPGGGPGEPPVTSLASGSEEELRDLAFLLFTAVAASGAGGITPQQAAGLTRVLAQQLCVEEARVADIQRVLRHIQPALFDTEEEGTYIDDAALVLQFLDGAMWPALGLSPPAALAVSAWVHFSMYVGTGCREQRLVKQLKGQIGKLALQAEAGSAKKPADPFGLGEDALRGDSAERLAGLLTEALCDSGAAAFGRAVRARVDAAASVSGVNSAVLDVFRTANALEQRLDAPATNMTTWSARALSTEKWKALGSGPEAAHTGSAAEVFRMASEALDALYGMDVPMPPGVQEALMEAVDGVLKKWGVAGYVTHVNDKLGPLQRLIPPTPPLTRYKKDVVVKQEAAEVDTGKAGSKSTNKKPVFLVPGVEASPDFTNIHNGLSVAVVAAAACSLNYLRTRAEMLAQRRGRGADTGRAHRRPVVFWDQRFGWLELLYRHRLSNNPASRIEPLLDALHKVLGTVCPSLPDTVRTTFAKCLFQASVQDVPALEQLKLRALFHADGEGLAREALDAELERVGRLVPLMRTEVGPLMDLLKTRPP
eukprot:XP_001699531.1 predicted protein [Chlamydomonas reinhardtii]